MSRRLTLGFGLLIVLFAAAQLVPVRRTNPPVVSPIRTPADVGAVLDRCCLDCHTNGTRWPWYSHVAPMSWLVVNHVKTGRANLNFSYWGALPVDEQRSAAKDVVDQLSAGTMPLRSYLLLHRDARVSVPETGILRAWFSSPAAIQISVADSAAGGAGSRGSSLDGVDPSDW
jgi:hypothetical protein